MKILSHIFILAISIKTGFFFPSNLQQCKLGDSACIISTINQILHKADNGIEDLGLPALRPYKVDKIILSESKQGNSLALDLIFKNVDFFGLTSAVVNKIVGFDKDPSTSKFEFYGTIPKMELKAKYTTNGRILILPIQGEGDAVVVGTNVNVSVKFKPEIFQKNQKIYFKNVKVKVLLVPERLQINLDNLFNGDKILGDNMNRFLNENWSDVWSELAPNINLAIATIIEDILTRIFRKISYEEFYLK